MKVFYFHFYGTSKPISYSQATEKTSDPKNVISNNSDNKTNKAIYKFTFTGLHGNSFLATKEVN